MRIINEPINRKNEKQTPLQRKSQKGASSTTSASAETGSKSNSPFIEILEEILPSHSDESTELNQLWQQLPDIERQLVAEISNENLDNYKQLVKKIAELTLKKNLRTKKISRKGRNGNGVELTVVEIVNEKLEKMTRLIYSPSNSAFSILKSIEDIRGLLLDRRN